MKNMNYYISEEDLQFQIKNTKSGSWFVDIRRVSLKGDAFIWTDVYLDYQGDQFFHTIEDALDNAVSHLNHGNYIER